ncbi:uncharacterized protein LOC116842493 isoform X2 [Odontomachus brunneus]|uniref:uncharacterized protein LOC116842493 isoform X2 n=1 Tax=Odontomachus brunneus TaxID=486640 RepID=UPI0013F29A0D|nr:uncharacterized protein LOC116842493 isoform X2 [Odontomachus brunneus]
MRKNSLRKNTFSPLTQKIRAPQHLLRLKNEESGLDNENSGRFQLPSLPSLPRRKSWKDDDNVLSTGNSAATSVSWSQEAENVATQRLEEQWATVERSFYEEDDELPQGPALDECIQWRTQIPYLRLMGRNSAGINNKAQLDICSSGKARKKLGNLQNDEVLMERSLSIKEEENSTQYKLNKAKFEEVLDLLMEYIVPELFPDKEDDTDSLHESLSDTLKITPAPLHSNRNSSKSTKTNWAEEAVSPNYIENKSLSIRNRLLDTESSLQTIKNDTNYQAVQKQRNSVSASKPKDYGGVGDDDALKTKERLCTPHIGRNKLGTVFNERIVVTPVPFAVSTRESFSTLKNTPIRFMGENFEISSFRGSARNVLGFRGSAKKSSLRNPDIHSAWQAPVCPAVWPKNVRLAPIDTSRLPSSKNRSQAPSSTVLHCSRKSLSPISRPTIPKSAYAAREHDSLLQIQGKHVVPAQSSKISLLSAGWDHSPRVSKSKKKKSSAKEGP